MKEAELKKLADKTEDPKLKKAIEQKAKQIGEQKPIQK